MSRPSGVAERIRTRILRGEIGAGERLVEIRLAETLRTSRSTLREALRLLEGRGLVVANEAGGMRVVSLEDHELEGALRVRAALEAHAAGEAAERMRRGGLTPEALDRPSSLADTHRDDPDAAVFADRTFHLAVDALAGNRAGHVVLDHLWDRIVVGALRAGWTARDQDHHDLIAAIAAGDPEHAASIAHRHAHASPCSPLP
jgi:DNA-binding GntR family transcriptional regulator